MSAPDDFGAPETAFLACNFWYIDALATIGRARRGARAVRSRFWPAATPTASCRRTFIPRPGELWGNLPQTYSMAGIINTATRLSSSWEDAWARG